MWEAEQSGCAGFKEATIGFSLLSLKLLIHTTSLFFPVRSRQIKMPVTIGSVGDIIAICLLVKDCVEALNESRGAAASYQAVIRELYILEKALLEVDLLARTYGATDELSAMFESAKAAVNACQTSLQAFKSKTRRFEPHLDPSTNRSTTQRVFKGSAMKLLWQVSMKDEVARFRAEVVAYSLSINQLVATAMMYDGWHPYKWIENVNVSAAVPRMQAIKRSM